MRLKEILQCLRGILPHEGAKMTTHSVSRNHERAICLIPPRGTLVRLETVGAEEGRGFEAYRLFLLIRWGRDGDDAYTKAWQIYRTMEKSRVEILGKSGFMIVQGGQPTWLGADERGVFEYAFEFDLYLNEEE